VKVGTARLSVLAIAAILLVCTETIEVTIERPAVWTVYGSDSIRVSCHPARTVDYVELLVDSVAVGRDSYPTYVFGWDPAGLPEGSQHAVQASAVSGSHEFRSAEHLVTIGYHSRLVMDGPGESLWVYVPGGQRDTQFVPLDGGNPICPRFTPNCQSVVFLAHRNLYQARVGSNEADLLDSLGNGIFSCDAGRLGNLVVYEGMPAATSHLFLLGTDSRTQLTHDSDAVLIDSSLFTCTANSNPAFSPNDNRIAFYRESKCLVPGDPHEGETRQDVFVMNRSGTELVNLTPHLGNGYFTSLTWTFDGKWVLFREGATTPQAFYAANLQGKVVGVLGVVPMAMACSPLDSGLVFISPDNLHRLLKTTLTWSNDTLYADRPIEMLNNTSFDRYVDWEKYW
jgi:hypothetical protein